MEKRLRGQNERLRPEFERVLRELPKKMDAAWRESHVDAIAQNRNSRKARSAIAAPG